MHAYLMLFAALSNAVCSHNASFFHLFLQMLFVFMLCLGLALLDFSSAFDTIDHTILVHRLHTDFGITDTVLQWFSSYLTDRTHYVSLCNH